MPPDATVCLQVVLSVAVCTKSGKGETEGRARGRPTGFEGSWGCGFFVGCLFLWGSWLVTFPAVAGCGLQRWESLPTLLASRPAILRTPIRLHRCFVVCVHPALVARQFVEMSRIRIEVRGSGGVMGVRQRLPVRHEQGAPCSASEGARCPWLPALGGSRSVPPANRSL
jgi:hypothetical protein